MSDDTVIISENTNPVEKEVPPSMVGRYIIRTDEEPCGFRELPNKGEWWLCAVCGKYAVYATDDKGVCKEHSDVATPDFKWLNWVAIEDEWDIRYM